MVVHCVTPNYSENDLNHAINHSTYIEVPSGCWNDLRMTSLSLRGVMMPEIANTSFGCKGIKRYQRSNFIMIKYDMSLQGDVDWNIAEKRFQDFLHRKLNIDKSSVQIHGIVSTSDTWYIMEGTEALLQALNNRVKEARNDTQSKTDSKTILLSIGTAVTIAALIIFFRR